MGGDTISPPTPSIDDEEDQSTCEPQFPDRFSDIPTPWPSGGLIGEKMEENESVFGESDATSFRNYCNSLEVEANERRICSVYAQVIKNYDELKNRTGNLEVAKRKIMSYTPGSWVENVGGMTIDDHNVPKSTTLLLIGPKGSGKSSLINKISRVFEDDKFAPERAQVTYNSTIHDGTLFLQEYMIPRSSTSFCLYDTRGLSNDLVENLDIIKQWMTKGVCHGELVKSALDNSSLQDSMKCKSRQDKPMTYERRRVGFVIFVVNGLSVLKCMDNNGADAEYMQMVTKLFGSPFLSFKDHKPVIAITHGDLLSLPERARIRVRLGELLGVHPCKQIFDIPDSNEPTTEMTIIDLVRYALEHADRNLPCKPRPTISKMWQDEHAGSWVKGVILKCELKLGSSIQLWTHLLLLLAVGILIFTVHLHGFHYLKLHPESVPEPNLEIKKVMEFQQESVPESNLEINKVMEFQQESVPEADLVQESQKESVPETHLDMKKVMEFEQEIVPEPNLEMNKVMEFQQESDPDPGLEIKKGMEVRQENVPEPNLEMKEDRAEIISKQRLEIKNIHAEGIPEKNRKKKRDRARRVPETKLEIDWKKIRHLWYK